MQSSPSLKYSLIAVNGIIILYSIIIISIQAASFVHLQDQTNVTGDSILGVAVLGMSVACVALVVASLGVVTAYRTSYCLGITLCVILSMILMLEVLLSVAYIVVFQLNVEDKVKTRLMDSMSSYDSSQPVALWWDQLHAQFECCGSSNAGDWLPVLNASDYLPMSCCARITGQVGNSSCAMASINRYKYACATEVTSYLQQNAAALGYTLLGLACVQVVCIIIAGLFTHPLKSMW